MRSLNGWRAWLKTLRRTWDPDCNGTSNSSPGGPPTMWVRKNSSSSLSPPLFCHSFGHSPGSWIRFKLSRKAVCLIMSPSVPLSSPTLCVAQVSDWWEEYIYLRGRGPIMVNSNYYAMVRHFCDWFSEGVCLFFVQYFCVRLLCECDPFVTLWPKTENCEKRERERERGDFLLNYLLFMLKFSSDKH